jgi:hypothetical protein
MIPAIRQLVSWGSAIGTLCLLLCLVGLVLTPSRADAQSLAGVPSSKRKVIDTGLESLAHAPPINPIQWLDDHSFTFNALQSGPDAKLKKAMRGVLYDLRTRSYITIVEDGTISCGAGDLVRSRRAGSDRAEYLRVSADRRSVTPAGELSQKGFGLDWYTCQGRKQPSTPGRLEYFLREQDGYIDRGRVGDGAVEQAILHRPGKPPLELPIRGKDISPPLFFPFLGRYYIGGWRLLSPDGTISPLPKPRSIENLVGFGPGRGGIVRDGIVSAAGTSEHGDWGLFHATDRGFERLFSGWVSVISASPDGCRVAFIGGPGFYFKDRNTLKFVQLCDEA